MNLYSVTPPAAAVVSLADLKAHLRVDHDDENALITALETAAVALLDGWDGTLGRALLSQTWELRADDFGCEIRLPLPPLISVTSVKYYDENNALQTLSADVYQVVGIGSTNPACIVLNDGETWPTVYTRREAVQVRYVAGYTAVPTPIVQAIKLLVGHWYQNRESVAVGVSTQELPMAVKALLAPYTVQHFS